MKFIFNRQSGEVKMRLENDGEISYDTEIMDEIIIEPTEDELDKINQNYKIFIDNGLRLEPNAFTEQEQKKEAKNTLIDGLNLTDEQKQLLKTLL